MLENARRWSGFVCPDCRFVFRVPRDHDGRGVVCPSCRRLLRIPQADEVPPPLVIHAVDDEDAPKKKRRRRERARRRTGLDWERRAETEDEDAPSHAKFKMLGLLLAGFLLLASVVLVLMSTLSHRAPEPVVIRQEVVPEVAKEEVPGEYAPYTEAGFFEAAEALMGRFLNAGSVDEILPLIRDPEIAAPRLREVYSDGVIDPPGMDEFNIGWDVQRKGRFFVLNVRTGGRVVKPAVIELRPDGLKVDWECWYGWSEMTWDDFMKEKPTSGKMFRVSVNPVDYYNFGFTDDGLWQSYRLFSPDGGHALYGYVRRGSEIQSELDALATQNGSLCILKLSYPEGAQTPEQVIIEELITVGWIIENQDSP